MKEDIKAILRDFYRGRASGEISVHCQLIGHCAPEIPAAHVEAVLKEFAVGEFSLETLDASAEKILAYRPEAKKKDRYQVANEE